MTVDKAAAKHTIEIGGEMYYFCCPHCKASFAKAPLDFARGKHA